MSMHSRSNHSRKPMSSTEYLRKCDLHLPPYFLHILLIMVPILVMINLGEIRSPTENKTEDHSTITRGSSLFASPKKTNYLLSPSGKFAFGFKSLGKESDKYKIGIWIVNSSEETLVWVPNPSHDEPVERDSSILLNGEGEFVIRKPGFMDEKLMSSVTPGLISYGVIHDSGNFVIYNNESKIVWQSFDYPTDTIVQGQTLKSGGHLLSKIGDYKVKMEEKGDLVVIRKEFRDGSFAWYYHWRSNTGNKGSPVELKLDADGRLYVVDWDLRVIKNITNGEENSAGESIYRATMYSDGYFRLYKEYISSEEAQKSVLLWQSGCIPCDEERERALEIQRIVTWTLRAVISAIVLLVGGFAAMFYLFG